MIPGCNWRHSWWRFGGRAFVFVVVLGAVAWGMSHPDRAVHIATGAEHAGPASNGDR